LTELTKFTVAGASLTSGFRETRFILESPTHWFWGVLLDFGLY